MPLTLSDCLEKERYPHLVEALERQAPFWEPDRAQGYHAITFGFYARELFERIAGESMGTFLNLELFEPLGADVSLGTPAAFDDRVATLYPPKHAARLVRMLASAVVGDNTEARVLRSTLSRSSLTRRAFFNPKDAEPAAWNHIPVRRAELCAGSATASAQGLSRAYVPFASRGAADGRRYLKATSLAPIYERQGWSDRDLVLQKPLGFSQGFVKEEAHLFSPVRASFGHPGIGGSLGFCDPENELTIGYVMNRLDWRVRSPRALSLCHALTISKCPRPLLGVLDVREPALPPAISQELVHHQREQLPRRPRHHQVRAVRVLMRNRKVESGQLERRRGEMKARDRVPAAVFPTLDKEIGLGREASALLGDHRLRAHDPLIVVRRIVERSAVAHFLVRLAGFQQLGARERGESIFRLFGLVEIRGPAPRDPRLGPIHGTAHQPARLAYLRVALRCLHREIVTEIGERARRASLELSWSDPPQGSRALVGFKCVGEQRRRIHGHVGDLARATRRDGEHMGRVADGEAEHIRPILELPRRDARGEVEPFCPHRLRVYFAHRLGRRDAAETSNARSGTRRATLDG